MPENLTDLSVLNATLAGAFICIFHMMKSILHSILVQSLLVKGPKNAFRIPSILWTQFEESMLSRANLQPI
jgi:hypothetical protein